MKAGAPHMNRAKGRISTIEARSRSDAELIAFGRCPHARSRTHRAVRAERSWSGPIMVTVSPVATEFQLTHAAAALRFIVASEPTVSTQRSRTEHEGERCWTE